MDLFLELKKSLSELEKLLSAETVAQFRHVSYGELHAYHFGLGTYIRNHLLGDQQAIYQMFLQCGCTERDDMSDLLIRLFYLDQRNRRSR